MESPKKSTKGRYALVVGIAGGFATLGTLSIAIYKNTDAAEISAVVAIFCSLIAVFISGDKKGKPCAETKTFNA
jgi:fluoride ion exporter CrcB/FEX